MLYPYYLLYPFTRRNYIASNLQDSQVEVYFYALRNTPADLARVHYHRGTKLLLLKYLR